MLELIFLGNRKWTFRQDLKLPKYLPNTIFQKMTLRLFRLIPGEIDVRQEKKIELGKDLFFTQKDKAELIDIIQNIDKLVSKTINVAGLIQFLAIIGSIPAILDLLFK